MRGKERQIMRSNLLVLDRAGHPRGRPSDRSPHHPMRKRAKKHPADRWQSQGFAYANRIGYIIPELETA